MTFPTPESMMLVLVLAILAGSLLGSVGAYLFGGSDPAPRAAQDYGYVRPAHWPGNQGNDAGAAYGAWQEPPAPRRRGLISLLFVFALTFGVGTAGIFSYQSPWSWDTDLKYLAATLDCRATTALGVAPVLASVPGYQAWLDPDGNGATCDTMTESVLASTSAPALASASASEQADLGATRHPDKFSDTALAWPPSLAGGN